MSSIIPPIAPTLALNFEQCRNNADAAAMIKRYGLVFGRASAGTYMDRAYILRSATTNEPRMDFAQAGSARGVFVEKSSSNIFTAPDPATNPGTGTVNNVTFAVNDWGLGLNGMVVFGDNSVDRDYYQATVAASTQYTASFLIKPDNGVAPTFGSGSLNIGRVKLSGSFISGGYTVTEYAPGIWKVRVTATSGASNLTLNGLFKLTSNNSVGFEASAIQFETGPNDTSYIPASGSPTTRAADILTGTGISSLIGQSEFNILAKVDTRSYNSGAARVIADIREDANNYAQLRKTTGGAFEFELVAGGVQQALITDPTGSREGVFKIGARAKANDFALFVSGASVGTPDVSGTVPTLSKLGVGHAIDGSLNASNWFGDRVGQLYLYNRGLTDAVNLNATRQV
jgi:hypothetical protein